MCHDGEAALREQGSVLGAVKACVVQRLAAERAHRHAVGRAAREQERGAWGRVRAVDGEHAALIIVREMEEAVPSEDAVEAAAQRQDAHVPDAP